MASYQTRQLAEYGSGFQEIARGVPSSSRPIGSKVGEEARLKLLAGNFPWLGVSLEKHRGLSEDVIDAHAMLWTAQRIAAGTAHAMPKLPEKDSRGLLMQIWA